MDTAPACLQRRLLPGDEVADPGGRVKGAIVNPTKRSYGKLADVVPGDSKAPDEEVVPTALPDSPSCDTAPQPVLPVCSRRDGHNHLTVHTLLPEAVIQDSLAALKSYYGVPGCTHSPANAAADPGAVQPDTQCRPSQQQFPSWHNLPRLNILSLSLPSDAPCTDRIRLGHDPASQEPHLCLSGSYKGTLPCPGVQGRHHRAFGAATALSTAATAATASVMAHLANMGTPNIQRAVRTGHNMLTMPNRLLDYQQPELEQQRQASLVGRHYDAVHAGMGNFTPCHSADTNNTKIFWQPSSNDSVSNSGQLTGPRRQLLTMLSNNISCQEDADCGSPVAFLNASSMNGLAQSSSSCKCQVSSSDATALSCQDKLHITDTSAVAANVASLLHIQLDQPAEGALETLQDVLQGSPHTTASDSAVSNEHHVQLQASSPAATQTAAVCKPGTSQELHMQLPLNNALPESPRASRQPILIDSPRPVCSPRVQGISGAAAHSTACDARQDKAVGNEPGQQQRRPPGAFVGHDPSKVLVAGGMGLRNSFCSCGGLSVLSDPSSRLLVANQSSGHLGSLHAASLVADAAAAGAADTGVLLQHVLQSQPKEPGGPIIQLAPWKQCQTPVMQTMEPSRAGLLQQAAVGDALTTWKQPR